MKLIKAVTIPCKIVGKHCGIITDAADSDIPIC